MKIASAIKPRRGISLSGPLTRDVTVHDKLYSFKPEVHAGETHFVAEVEDPKHQQVLLDSGAFYALDDEGKRKPALTRKPVTPGNTETSKPAQVPGSEAEQAEAKTLLEGNAEQIGVAVAKVSSLNVLRAAIDLEAAAAKPRKNVQTLLQAALDGAIAAGVKG